MIIKILQISHDLSSQLIQLIDVVIRLFIILPHHKFARNKLEKDFF